MSWISPQTFIRFERWMVAGIFMLGSVAGLLLAHCSEPPLPRTVLQCQQLTWFEWLAIHPDVFAGPTPISTRDAFQLVREIRRCAGKDTVFQSDIDSSDPFGIEGLPSERHDAGGAIYRSQP